MKKFVMALLLAANSPWTWAAADHWSIHGRDDRLDWHQVSDPVLLNWAASTAALIPHANFTSLGDGAVRVHAVSYGANKNLCPGHRYFDQPVPGDCSAFLVGDDLMVTAGHCIETMADCRKYAFVFDYAIIREGVVPEVIHESQIYSCRRIVAHANQGKNDFAVIRLDRVAAGRTPLPIRRSGQMARGTKLVIIGHPGGLPSKIADGGEVLTTRPLNTSVDAFAGNSGSAVINRHIGLVEGILIDGGTDYVKVGGCYKEYRCQGSNCEGEGLYPIKGLKRYIPESIGYQIADI